MPEARSDAGILMKNKKAKQNNNNKKATKILDRGGFFLDLSRCRSRLKKSNCFVGVKLEQAKI